MSRSERNGDDVMRSLPSASEPQIDAALARVHARLQSDRGDGAVPPIESPISVASNWPLAVAAAMVIAAVGTAIVLRTADTPLFRVVEGDVYQGDTIRSNGGGGAVLTLADSSRIEMRSPSELSLERAADGVRIRLHSGGIIVNAAKQRAGHLYVRTKEMTVSVVGTVFLVNADDGGSRVAVIEGTVRVQQGATDTNLLPGDQVATRLAKAAAPITEEIAWSRNAAQHRALLRQSAATAFLGQPAAASADTRLTFQEISVRPAAPSSRGGRGTPFGGPAGPSCAGTDLQVDPSRFAVRNIPLYGLITLAYGKTCQPQVQHVGGPAWMRTDGYDIEAAIPPGSPGYTTRQLRDGMAPGLALMLQTMLADRFKLVLGRDMREMSVYHLVVVSPGRLKPSEDQNPPERAPGGPSVFTPRVGVVGPVLSLSSAPLSRLTGLLQSLADRPVIDRTGLTGLFDVMLNFPDLNGMSGVELEIGMRDQLSSRLEEQLGLTLEPARALVEVLVIERAERPTEN
jgi:uncharacterized protein (TIGR03435 family)